MLVVGVTGKLPNFDRTRAEGFSVAQPISGSRFDHPPPTSADCTQVQQKGAPLNNAKYHQKIKTSFGIFRQTQSSTLFDKFLAAPIFWPPFLGL